jgi:broad specificity phosphatase PhoE
MLSGPTTLRGRRQVKRISRLLAGERVAHVFSSDLKRAQDAAREIAIFHNAPVEFLPQLREINCGVLEGKSLQSARKTHRAIVEARLRDKYNYCIPGGESYGDVEKRVRPFLLRLKRNFANKTVIVVSHEAVSRVILKILLKLAPKDAVRVSQPNDCIYRLNVPLHGKGKTAAEHYCKNSRGKGLLWEKAATPLK